MKFEIYCDESRPELFTSQNATSHFLSIGGIWIPADSARQIKMDLKRIREEHKYFCEIKWTKVNNTKLSFYISLIDYFLSNPAIRFRTIVIDCRRVDFMRFHNNDAELGFYKFYYQLIHHWILDFNEYRIFVDIKTNRRPDRLNVLHKVLNNSNLSSMITSVQALPSNEVQLIQMADLLIGAVNAKFNGLSLKSAKGTLIKHIETRLEKEISPTSKCEEKFNVFKINLQGGW